MIAVRTGNKYVDSKKHPIGKMYKGHISRNGTGFKCEGNYTAEISHSEYRIATPEEVGYYDKGMRYIPKYQKCQVVKLVLDSDGKMLYGVSPSQVGKVGAVVKIKANTNKYKYEYFVQVGNSSWWVLDDNLIETNVYGGSSLDMNNLVADEAGHLSSSIKGEIDSRGMMSAIEMMTKKPKNESTFEWFGPFSRNPQIPFDKNNFLVTGGLVGDRMREYVKLCRKNNIIHSISWQGHDDHMYGAKNGRYVSYHKDLALSNNLPHYTLEEFKSIFNNKQFKHEVQNTNQENRSATDRTGTEVSSRRQRSAVKGRLEGNETSYHSRRKTVIVSKIKGNAVIF